MTPVLFVAAVLILKRHFFSTVLEEKTTLLCKIFEISSERLTYTDSKI